MLKKLFKQLMAQPELMRRAMNFYAPLRGAGIRIARIAPGFQEIEVHMPLTRSNKNIMGTHFGGSLYAMADPFFMLMLMQRLGPRYHVWDQEATIRFIAPGTGLVKGLYQITEEALQHIVASAAGGDKVLYTFEVDIVGEQGQKVAEVSKVLYIRLKKQHRPNQE